MKNLLKKSSASAILLLFAALFVLAACEKKSSKYGVLYVDSIGMTHVLATDENGSTIQDANGNLVEILTDDKSKQPLTMTEVSATDEDGSEVSAEPKTKYQSSPLTFPHMITDKNGKTVENRYYKMPIPDGWEQIGSVAIILRQKDTECQIEVQHVEYEDAEESLKEVEAVKEKLTDDELKFTKDTVKLCGTDAYKCVYDFNGNKRYIYILEKNGNVFNILCSAKSEYDKATDFESILNSIEFK
ncbi:MAG: hypothetical protein K6F09_01180 [Clostridiales bacterium]|nr:hypothetical protein [Clostridiales bacterium]